MWTALVSRESINSFIRAKMANGKRHRERKPRVAAAEVTVVPCLLFSLAVFIFHCSKVRRIGKLY